MKNSRAWLMWLIATIFYLYEFMHRLNPSVMVPELMFDYQISAQAVGAISAWYFYAYASVQIPVGLILDRFEVRKPLTIAVILVALGSLIFARTESVTVAKFARILIGIGSAFSFNACLKIAAEWFKRRYFSLLIGLTNLMGILGALIGGRPWGAWTHQLGWRQTMEYSAYFGFLIAVLMAITLKDKDKQKPFSLKNLQDDHWPSIWRHIVTQPVFKIACFGCCIVAPIAAITELWGPSFLVAKYGFTRLNAASIASASFVGIAIGGPLVGYLVGQNISARKILLFGLIGAWLSMVLALYVPALPWQILIGLFFMFGLSSSSMLLCFSENALGAPKYMQATIIGITNTIIMAGSGLIQKAVSQLLHWSAISLNYTANDFHLAFLILPLCQVLALGLWLSLPKPAFSE